MVDVSIVNETTPEANWNRQASGQAGGQANLCVGRLRLQKWNLIEQVITYLIYEIYIVKWIIIITPLPLCSFHVKP